jgi:hypothetical protein
VHSLERHVVEKLVTNAERVFQQLLTSVEQQANNSPKEEQGNDDDEGQREAPTTRNSRLVEDCLLEALSLEIALPPNLQLTSNGLFPPPPEEATMRTWNLLKQQACNRNGSSNTVSPPRQHCNKFIIALILLGTIFFEDLILYNITSSLILQISFKSYKQKNLCTYCS